MKPKLLMLPASDEHPHNLSREASRIMAIMDEALSLDPAQVEALACVAGAIREMKCQLRKSNVDLLSPAFERQALQRLC